MKSLIILILSSMLVLFGCEHDKSSNKIPKDDRIDILVHQEKVDNGVVLFYVPKLFGDEPAKARFEARFIKKNLFGWESTFDRGGSSGITESNIFSQYLPKYSRSSPFPMLFGEITDPRIEKIKVENEYGTTVKETKVIKNKGKQFWFIFVEEPKLKTAYKISGYSINDELIETVEEESIP